MRRIYITFSCLFIILAFVFVPNYLFARGSAGDYGLTNIAKESGLTERNRSYGKVPFGLYVGGVLEIVLAILGLVFFIIIVYAGIRWLTAQGSEESVERAKSTLMQAFLGFLFIAAAYTFTIFILKAVERAVLGKG